MPKTKPPKKENSTPRFHMEFKNGVQRHAWDTFQKNDVLFLTGPAGVGKSHLAMAFAIHEILQRSRKRIILTRPIVEAGENLGYLPGSFEEKVNPYMLPLFDCMKKLVGASGLHHDLVATSLEIAPLAYMRGRSFSHSVCIFDEAQNATFAQLKLFLSRMDENSKMIITGDPEQSDLGSASGLVDVLARLQGVPGIGVVKFEKDSIVRHPLVAAILEKLEN
jgi:phosphate starvation-inducible PhoH-like protein